MTRPTIAVAPREITDLAFRACRVGGCDASVADRVSADISHCEVQHGCGLTRLVALLTEDSVADTFGATQRRHLAHDRVGCSVECADADRARTDDPDIERAALAVGVHVDVDAWTALERRAADFVLSEDIIDVADTPTV